MNETIKLVKILESSDIDWFKLWKEWEKFLTEVYVGEIELDQIDKKVSQIFEGVDKNAKSLIIAAFFGVLVYHMAMDFFFLGL